MSEHELTDQEFADIFWEEWRAVEAERLSIIKDLFAICRAMHNLRGRLNDNMLQVLVENAWKESEVTRNLAAATVLLLKALAGLGRKRSAEGVFLEKCEPVKDDPLWDSLIGTV